MVKILDILLYGIPCLTKLSIFSEPLHLKPGHIQSTTTFLSFKTTLKTYLKYWFK